MLRIPVLSPDGKPLMPTKPSRARRWIRDGLAVGKWSDLSVFYVQLTQQPSGEEGQPIAVGVDPGKLYSGVGVQSPKATLFLAHLILPFQTIKDRMEQRRIMRRGRRGRRINRKVAYSKRAHRQKRFDSRRQNKLPPSIRANRQLELRVVTELCRLFPVSKIVYEYVEARGSKSFSPVMVGQKVMLGWLSKLAPVETQFGYETANLRTQLGLVKSKDKAAQTPESHAVDGLALACSAFIQYELFHTTNTRGHAWTGSVELTPSVFRVIRRPPISRRQLHLMVPAKGGVRRKYGGTTTRHGVRKGDIVRAEMAGRVCVGWVSGDTQKQISVSDANWKRLGQFTASKVQLLARANGLVVSRQSIGGYRTPLSKRTYSSPRTRRRGFPVIFMKRAISIYLGTLVPAEEADRSTYKDWGLICPVKGCGAPVYLAEGLIQDKHFRHMPDRGKPDCSERSQRMTEDEWGKLQRKTEAQYLRYFQQNFWRIFTQSLAAMQIDKLEEDRQKDKATRDIWLPMFQEWRAGLVKHRDGVRALANDMVQMILNHEAKTFTAEAAEAMANLTDQLERRTHINSVMAGIDFLLNDSSIPILEAIFCYTLFDYSCYVAKDPRLPVPTGDLLSNMIVFPWLLSDVIGLMMIVPWAQAAQELKRTGAVSPASVRHRPRLVGHFPDASAAIWDW